MNIPEKVIINKLKQQYSRGSRVVLDIMQDPYREMPNKLQGTVIGVDDCGTVHCHWDNGSTLGVVYGEDRCHRVATDDEIKISLEHIQRSGAKPYQCPRCGITGTSRNRLLALSRRADITICEHCGMLEALEDAGLIEVLSLKNWKIVEAGWKL